MRLIHYSKEPLVEVQSASQRNAKFFKPKGLWVTTEDEYNWKWWCEQEEFELGNLAIATEILLIDEPNLLVIKTAYELDAFHQEYSDPMIPELSYYKYPDWHRIAAKYDGIVITPYLWKRRLDPNTPWYYAWDCASGCLWNKGIVKGLLSYKPTYNTENIKLHEVN